MKKNVLNLDYSKSILSFFMFYVLLIVILFISIHRDFGTDIYSYRRIFSGVNPYYTSNSIEWFYKLLIKIFNFFSIKPIYLVEFISLLTISLLCVNITKFSKKPLTESYIILSFLLFQHFFGSIRMGLSIVFLLHFDRLYLLKNKKSFWSIIGCLFHWSQFIHLSCYIFKIKYKHLLIISIVPIIYIFLFDSIKPFVFSQFSELQVISEYSSHDYMSTLNKPPYASIIIHFLTAHLVYKLIPSKVASRLYFPLTIIFVSNYFFYDFIYIGERVSNLFISFKILMLIEFSKLKITGIYNIPRLIFVYVYPAYIIYSYTTNNLEHFIK
jgi:hypothetical protein